MFKRISGQKLNTDGKQKHFERCQRLLLHFPSDQSIRRVWFSDEKIFMVANPVNMQNDGIHSSADGKKEIPASCLVRECEHFSRSVMVSVAVSKVGKTSIMFVEPGAKVNSNCYCTRVLGYLSQVWSVVNTGGLCSRTACHCRWLGTPSRTCSIRMSPSLNRTCGHPTARLKPGGLRHLEGPAGVLVPW